jgi:hypothetical protein
VLSEIPVIPILKGTVDDVYNMGGSQVSDYVRPTGISQGMVKSITNICVPSVYFPYEQHVVVDCDEAG